MGIIVSYCFIGFLVGVAFVYFENKNKPEISGHALLFMFGALVTWPFLLGLFGVGLILRLIDYLEDKKFPNPFYKEE